MKRSISHLPKHKQEELKLIISAIRNIAPKVEMIILFGSFARGNWVEDLYIAEGITYEYRSDFDLLLIVENIQDVRLKGLSKKIRKKIQKNDGFNTQVSLIVHTIVEVNREISQGNYFFFDIKREGIMLYNSKKFKLASKKDLSIKERKGKAKTNFKNWFESAKGFYKFFEFGLQENNLNGAAFQLHQATERFYHTTLLVFTDYKPKLHDIEELGNQVSKLDKRFNTVFSRKNDEDQKLFYLLKKAYTEARYNMGFKISKNDLEILAKRVKKLEILTEKICQEKIKSLN